MIAMSNFVTRVSEIDAVPLVILSLFIILSLLMMIFPNFFLNYLNESIRKNDAWFNRSDTRLLKPKGVIVISLLLFGFSGALLVLYIWPR